MNVDPILNPPPLGWPWNPNAENPAERGVAMWSLQPCGCHQRVDGQAVLCAKHLADLNAPSWQRGNWMQTFTGRKFYPMDPRSEDVDIIDIAHALSMQCRYNGHVQRFMSVAEHCVLVSQLVAPEHALWGLLHDATEAYVGDMVRPLKLHMPEYRAVEDQVMLAIAQKFGIDPAMPPEVKTADSRILLDERAALLGAPAGDWDVAGEPYGIKIPAWDPQSAKRTYLERFAELTEGDLT